MVFPRPLTDVMVEQLQRALKERRRFSWSREADFWRRRGCNSRARRLIREIRSRREA